MVTGVVCVRTEFNLRRLYRKSRRMEALPMKRDVRIVTPRYQQILGVKFFNGDVEEAIAFISRQGGFLVAPSGTCFSRLRHDPAYRDAVTHADLVIADSGAMVLL